MINKKMKIIVISSFLVAIMFMISLSFLFFRESPRWISGSASKLQELSINDDELEALPIKEDFTYFFRDTFGVDYLILSGSLKLDTDVEEIFKMPIWIEIENPDKKESYKNGFINSLKSYECFNGIIDANSLEKKNRVFKKSGTWAGLFFVDDKTGYFVADLMKSSR